MRKVLFLLILIHGVCSSFAQKPSIDTSILGKWQYVESPMISGDGKYASYMIENQPVSGRTLVVRETNGAWSREFEGASEGFYSGDNKAFIFRHKDTLCFLDLGKRQLKYISNVYSSKWPEKPQIGDMVAYQLNDAAKDLILLNLTTGKEEHFGSAEDYSFDKYGKVLLITAEVKKDSQAYPSLKWVSVYQNKTTTIWSDDGDTSHSTVSNCLFDEMGQQLVFIVNKRDAGQMTNAVWYYRTGLNGAIMKINSRSPGIDAGFSLAGPVKFSESGHWIFFNLKEPTDQHKPPQDAVKVDVWSYRDEYLQPEQMRKLASGPALFAAAMNVNDSLVVRLEKEDEELRTYPTQVTGDFVVIYSHNHQTWFYPSSLPSFYLVSLINGSRRPLQKNEHDLNNFSFSPSGKYLVYYNWKKRNYFSYNLLTDKMANITGLIPARVSSEYQRNVFPVNPVAPVAGWLEEDNALFVYDNYDIWEVDPSAVNTPINITNNYGYTHHIKLRLLYGEHQESSLHVFHRNEPLLLGAFDPVDKYNGFYQTYLNKRADPELLTMGPYTFYHMVSQTGYYYEFDEGMPPLKANEVNTWIVKRETACDAPNYFTTTDFKTYKRLSNIQPQADYNWLTTELITWKQFDGRISQGVLYKPENFDPNKRYPVIFNYYERLSHRLFEFPYPEFTSDNINIPYFVSQGFLIFTPDIHYRPANSSNVPVGGWAFNSVVSAAKSLSKLPYVDPHRMAIQGHSFGGQETNYLVTHTNLFAAAAEAAGLSDPISDYLTLVPLASPIEHFDPENLIEDAHDLYGATPWERPDLYRKNSAVLNADKTTTPLLIMHNIRDNQIQWRQGVELYMALRRLGRKVWMLQYDQGDHGVDGRSAIDYTVRLTQFFDYYLKDAAPPKWMTQGIPAKLKGLETGYELDHSGSKP